MKCNICKSKTQSLLNLNSQPSCSAYTKYHNTLDYNNLHKNNEISYPLHLHYCPNCFHGQLTNNVKVENNDFSIFSFPDVIIHCLFRLYNLNIDLIKSNIKILHICNNKNKLTNLFDNICTKEEIDNITVTTQNNLHNLDGLIFDIIILESDINNISIYFDYIKSHLNIDSILFIDSPILLKCNLNSISHKNSNYFNMNSMNLLCAKFDLILNYTTDYLNNYIFEITLKNTKDSNTVKLLMYEANFGFYNKDVFFNYKLKCMIYKNNFHNILINYKLQKKNIIGYGNSHTLLNSCNIDDTIIDYIIDTKNIGLFTPGTNILIESIDSFKLINEDTIIIISSKYNYESIKKIILQKKKEFNIQFPIEIFNCVTLIGELI